MRVNQALGLIETVGKVAAVTAMDAAVKAADITLISLENSRGQGRMCTKFVGEVSAVKAAVEAGVLATKAIGCEVYAYKVIARPSEQLDSLLNATMGHSYLESWYPDRKPIEAKSKQKNEEEVVFDPTKEEEKKDNITDSNKEINKNKKVNTQTTKSSKKSKKNKPANKKSS